MKNNNNNQVGQRQMISKKIQAYRAIRMVKMQLIFKN
jgi:hypothetical protein